MPESVTRQAQKSDVPQETLKETKALQQKLKQIQNQIQQIGSKQEKKKEKKQKRQQKQKENEQTQKQNNTNKTITPHQFTSGTPSFVIGYTPDASQYMAWRRLIRNPATPVLTTAIRMRTAVPLVNRIDYAVVDRQYESFEHKGKVNHFVLVVNALCSDIPRNWLSTAYTPEERATFGEHFLELFESCVSRYVQRIRSLIDDPIVTTGNSANKGRSIKL